MPPILSKNNRRYWELEFFVEWVAQARPEARVLTRVRLGPSAAAFPDPTLSDEERRMLGAAFRRWADAVLIERGTLTVVEAAMVPDPRDISLLKVYLRLVDWTPELNLEAKLPRKGLLLWAVDDPFSRAEARAADLEVVVWKPSNFSEWLTSAPQRQRRPVRALATLPSPAEE